MLFNQFNLDPRLLKNVQALDFEEPTPIQSATIPPALDGRDILGSRNRKVKPPRFTALLQKAIHTNARAARAGVVPT
jgi:hypothetical protein